MIGSNDIISLQFRELRIIRGADGKDRVTEEAKTDIAIFLIPIVDHRIVTPASEIVIPSESALVLPERLARLLF